MVYTGYTEIYLYILVYAKHVIYTHILLLEIVTVFMQRHIFMMFQNPSENLRTNNNQQ